jgi:site-specific recombinase XerD
MRWVAVAVYVTSYVQQYFTERGDLEDASPLFATHTGGQLTRQMLYKILKHRQSESGLPLGVHIFRHTFLTGTSKVSNEKIAQSLANRSTATTQRYIHTTAEERPAPVNGTTRVSELEDVG